MRREPPRRTASAASPAGASQSPPARPGERVLRTLGADPAFAEDVLGDLAEEHARRRSSDGAVAARLWYLRETARSAPHLAWSGVRRAWRHDRARLVGAIGGVVLAAGLALAAARLFLDGPPARLLAGEEGTADAIVVNNVQAIQLPVRVLDRAGHVLKMGGVRYRWAGGAPIAVSPTGVVKCTAPGDATVRASLGPLATELALRCRPVEHLEASRWMEFVVGDAPRHLPLEALGPDGGRVVQLRGSASVFDSTVAALHGSLVVPRGTGQTVVHVQVGDRDTHVLVTVHSPVRSFVGLRDDQRLVAAPVRLAQGDSLRWPLPTGLFWLKYVAARDDEPPPTITVDGQITCSHGDRTENMLDVPGIYRAYCLASAPGASVLVVHGRTGLPEVRGLLALERVRAAGEGAPPRPTTR